MTVADERACPKRSGPVDRGVSVDDTQGGRPPAVGGAGAPERSGRSGTRLVVRVADTFRSRDGVGHER